MHQDKKIPGKLGRHKNATQFDRWKFLRGKTGKKQKISTTIYHVNTNNHSFIEPSLHLQ